MNTRHTGVITALLLTAALFLYMPGLMRSFVPKDLNRMDPRLRPPKTRTLAVWLIRGRTGDEQLISQACAAFEKAHPGARVFLRAADEEELYAPGAVLPDAVLFDTGGITLPDKVLLPLLGQAESSAMYAGTCYAVPLWLSPNVLALPNSWFGQPGAAEGPSILASSTPPPSQSSPNVLDTSAIPWERIMQPGALQLPAGVALQQLLCLCPYELRQRLSACTQPAEAESARVLPLRDHLRETRDGKGTRACVLSPAVCDRVRYAALCRDTPDGRNLLSFLQSGMAQKALDTGFLPLGGEGTAQEPLMREAQALFGGVRTLPNAFAHRQEELLALCADSFQRGLDPVETLLKLR